MSVIMFLFCLVSFIMKSNKHFVSVENILFIVGSILSASHLGLHCS